MADNQQQKPRSKTPRKQKVPAKGFGTIKIPHVEVEASREAVRKAAAEKAERPVTLVELLVRFLPVWALIGMILIVAPTLPFQLIGRFFSAIVNDDTQVLTGGNEPYFIVSDVETPSEVAELPVPDWSLEISPVFTREVAFWEDAIGTWSVTYRIKPNLIATVMQIESCGNPQAQSDAGATSLFQVMPFHFEEGEDPFEPNTNAHRGMIFLATLLADTNGDVGLALASYNGGPGMMVTSPSNWPTETQNYQFWGSGIYEEAELGFTESPTLQQWLAAGGASLCQSAAVELGIAGQ